MTSRRHSFPDRNELPQVLDLVVNEARGYLEGLDQRPVLSQRVEESAASFQAPLPDTGGGATAALRQLIDDGWDAAAATSGPRCFHFVIGGVTPAALGADWLASLLDQPAYTWISSPLGVQLELVSLSWLKDLFDLPDYWSGVFTTGATMANFVGLAAARQWWAERHGVDISENGFAGLPGVPVFSSGHIHASAVKVLAMLGIGRSSVKRLALGTTGGLDLRAMEKALIDLDGAPAILIGNAGEVNAGEFDPIEDMANLAEKYNAWLHVDGAFGLFARVTEGKKHLAKGVERAHSVIVDGHKWLNVPYDCGFAFVHDVGLMGRAFAYTAAYLPSPDDPHPTLGAIGPESSRRARALAVWATLRAYGRKGYQELIENHLSLAQRMADLIDEAPDLERLADVQLNIVCFRFNPGHVPESELDDLNRRLGESILSDGRVFAGTTSYRGKIALRPAIVNWRTREKDVDFFVEVVRELAHALLPADS
ncbi:MAG: pyridoxal-dependent decarboxylase [Candidatus Krumholzibacteria bacterium]|nr:pyridoxal-dependent decarboxylase [Candidatus Krumholzibacteria bacterium]